MKKYGKFDAIIAKVVEIIQWSAALVLLLMIGAIGMFRIQINGAVLGLDQNSGKISDYGYSIMLLESDGMVNMKTLVFILFVVMISCVFTALIYHNVYLIVQTTRRVEYPLEEITPFSDKNVKRVRKIGIYCMLIPVVELLTGVVGRFLVAMHMRKQSSGLFLGGN